MPMTNSQLSELFADIAVRMEIKGDENPFAIRAYKAVSETIGGHTQALSDVWAQGGIDGLKSINGIGTEIAKKIDEIMRTGRLEFFEKLRVAVPDSVAAMRSVPNLGPKRAKQVWDALGIDSIEKLETAAQQGKLRDLPKFGAKLEQKILEGIAMMRRVQSGRILIGDVLPIAQELIATLSHLPQVKRIEYAGSLRRGKETIGDLDLIVATNDAKPIMDAFVMQPRVIEVLGHGDTKSSVRFDNGLQVDLRTVESKHWGCAMQYFTGSQQHNIRMREIAQKQGWSLNEYSLKPNEGSPHKRERFFEEESALYAALGLPYIPPELREDRSEFDTPLPQLITLDDMRGDLQMHSTWSDGSHDVMTMARAAIQLGYEYILITDHTSGLGVVNGLTPERVKEQRQDIDRVNKQLKKEGIKFRMLQGAEVEVKSDGSLDLPDETLAICDLVQASVHTSLSQPRAQITARAIKAISNPHVHILGHPSGRIINEREGADYDWDALFNAAREHQVALEINANPHRLDLRDTHARRAMELGNMLSISTDAHSPTMLDNMRYGVLIARRAWVTPERVINTWSLDKLLKWAKKV